MKKSVLFLMSAALLLGSNVMADDQPQVPNGDFETWTFDGENLPNNWNSFQTADGNYATMGYSSSNRQVKRSTDVRPGSEGQYSCAIWARSVLGVIAQGNLTSGRVHAGSMSATNKENYNYTDRDGSTTKNGVTNRCAMPFAGKPKAVKVWVKYVQGGTGYGEYDKAKFSAIIHGDGDYISYGLASNDNDANKALVVASAVKEIEYKDGEWEELTIPFEYTNNGSTPKYIQINASTNAYPGKGKANDYLYIDDIELVYESAGNVKTFDKDKLYVTVDDGDEKTEPNISGPYDATVYVTENEDNTINFQLKNFMLDNDGDKMPVGNINVNKIPVSVTDGITNFSDEQTIQIEEGDDPTAPYWVGPMLGEIPLKLSGCYNDEHLYVTIDIPMSDEMQVYVELGNQGDVTTVTSVKVSKKNAASGVIYDLNGRKVNEMQRGRFYIVDGKIVMN